MGLGMEMEGSMESGGIRLLKELRKDSGKTWFVSSSCLVCIVPTIAYLLRTKLHDNLALPEQEY